MLKKCKTCHARIRYRDVYGLRFNEADCPLKCEYSRNPNGGAPREVPELVLMRWEMTHGEEAQSDDEPRMAERDE